MASPIQFRFFKPSKNILLPFSVVFRNKSLSSHEWVERRQKDPYVEKAKRGNYRCRSAFKLIEIDDKYKLLHPGQNVIDLGAAPGSWSQVIVERINSDGNDFKKKQGKVISIDLSSIYEIEGATILSNMDFTLKSSQDRILEILNNQKLDLVLSDMSPTASGMKSLDAENSYQLAMSALIFSLQNLKPSGSLLIKMWEGQHTKIGDEIKRFYNKMNYVKPKASQKESSEIYLLGRDFKGLENDK